MPTSCGFTDNGVSTMFICLLGSARASIDKCRVPKNVMVLFWISLELLSARPMSENVNDDSCFSSDTFFSAWNVN